MIQSRIGGTLKTAVRKGLIAIAAALTVLTGTAGAASITLNWTAPGDDGTVGTATTYDIRYSTSTITQANWNSASQATGEPAPAAAGTPQSFTVTGLNSNTTYYFAMKTADEASNWSTLSNVVSITTADTIPPAPVTDLVAQR